jgi:drug/metabolite transporter (DMT)-like permease
MTEAFAHRKLDPSTLVLLVLPPLFWAGNAVVGRMMVGSLAPLELSFWRWCVALLAALPFTGVALWRARAQLWRQRGALARMGLLGIACYNSLQYVALHTTTPLNVALISSAGPVFIVLIGALCYRERVGVDALVGAALSAVGVIVVVTQGQLMHLAQLRLAVGDFVMLLAVLLWGFYTWELRRHPLGLPPLVGLSAQMAVGTVIIAPFALWARYALGEVSHWAPPGVAAVLYVALAASLLAYVCWGEAVARTGAQIPVYFANLLPVFVALLSFVFLHEGIRTYHVAGAALIFGGIHVALRGRARVGGRR